MPAKKTKSGKKYEITTKQFTWHPDVEDGETLPDVTIPLRLKLKVIRGLNATMDSDGMFLVLERLLPGQSDVLDEMDVNDFQEMFTAWQSEYNALTGATPGE